MIDETTIAALPRAHREELLSLLIERERRVMGRKWLTYYPDEGPLRRELYPKHMAFFAAGAKYQQRLLLAANRTGKCISHDTIIESPDGTSSRVGDITGQHWVWAWDGHRRVPALADAPFTKPAEMVYRVWLSSGQWFDCAEEHRLLTKVGWSFFSDLRQFLPCLPKSSSGSVPLESLGDVLRCLHRERGYPAGCLAGCRSGGEQPLRAARSDRSSAPSPFDVLKHNLFVSRLGGLVGKGIGILSRSICRLSNLCVADQIEAQSVAYQCQAGCSSGRLCLCLPQELLQPSIAASSDARSSHAKQIHQEQSSLALVSPDGLSSAIVCYQPLGVQVIYDFTVPWYHNYCTQGAIHHNTEGVGAYEVSLHMTGIYPKWWKGRRFAKPTRGWAAGDTRQTVRDILAEKLLGPKDARGTGMLPVDSILRIVPQPGVPDGVEAVFVQHKSGGVSRLGFKSYDQGRLSFQGTEQDFIWLDEEPPADVYEECLTRTATTNGLMLMTFTPLSGLSDVVMMFLPGGDIRDCTDEASSRFIIMATWDDVPHLDESVKKMLFASYMPFQRDARTKGIPALGSGAIYPVPESDIVVPDFALPDHWPRAYGMDVGWNRTAAIWGAIDPETKITYLYSQHYRGEAEPVVHAQSIKMRGGWIPGAIDPASRGRTQTDGMQLLEMYRDLGLLLELADNAVEAGIYDVWSLLSGGQMKAFGSCQDWINEYRIYRRDDKGRVVKKNDHLMDATRYLARTGREIAALKPAIKTDDEQPNMGYGGWMG